MGRASHLRGHSCRWPWTLFYFLVLASELFVPVVTVSFEERLVQVQCRYLKKKSKTPESVYEETVRGKPGTSLSEDDLEAAAYRRNVELQCCRDGLNTCPGNVIHEYHMCAVRHIETMGRCTSNQLHFSISTFLTVIVPSILGVFVWKL